MAEKNDKSDQVNQRRSERNKLEPERMTIAFLVETGDFDITDVNMSEEGLGFTTSEPIGIRVDITRKKNEVSRLANLVWAKRMENGKMHYGFEFLTSGSENASSTVQCRPSC